MKKYLIYWFVDRDIHIEFYDDLSACNSRKKEIFQYIKFFDDSDVFVYDLHNLGG